LAFAPAASSRTATAASSTRTLGWVAPGLHTRAGVHSVARMPRVLRAYTVTIAYVAFVVAAIIIALLA
jgi:hypothetical protein